MPAGAARDKMVHYLREARADELSLARTLRSHIAVAPRGPYRTGLEGYLYETREHARRLERRLGELGAGDGALRSGVSTLKNASGSLVAWGRGPLNAVRRASPEERLVRGAKHGCATEGLVIATYIAIETLANSAGDHDTAQLAADIRGDEERMLMWLRHEILKLTDAFIRVELDEADPIDRPGPRRSRDRGEPHWSDYDELSMGDVRHALSRSPEGGDS
jgi:ferritin-like metal-binding protein YciE